MYFDVISSKAKNYVRFFFFSFLQREAIYDIDARRAREKFSPRRLPLNLFTSTLYSSASIQRAVL
jgi:hypothetical protein